MGNKGTINGIIQHTIATGAAIASIHEVETKLKETEKAHQALSARWAEMTSSPQVAAYRSNKNIGDWEQTQLIVDLENLLGKLTLVVIAQQNVLNSVVGALKNLNKK